MRDDLLEPTLQEDSTQGPGTGLRSGGEAPWNPRSQFFVAFFGGPVAIGAIAWINAGRLRLSSAARGLIVGLSLLAWGVWLGVIAAVRVGALDFDGAESSRSWGRILGRAVAVVLYLALAGIQRQADRRWRMLGEGGEYASLWKAGTIAVVGGILLQIASGTLVVLLLPDAR